MKCTVNTAEFGKALQSAAKIVNPRATLNALTCIKLEVVGDELVVTGSDLDTTVIIPVKCNVEEEGACLVPASTIRDLIASYSADEVKLSLGKYKLSVVCGRSKGNVSVSDISDYPLLSDMEEASFSISIDGDEFKRVVGMTAISAAQDTSRPILTTVSISCDEGKWSAKSADGFRLSDVVFDCEGNDDSDGCLIPASALHLANSMLDNGVEITANNVMVKITDGDKSVVSTLIDGSFPDVKQIIPVGYAVKIKASSKDLLKAFKAANVFSRDSSNIVKIEVLSGVKLEIKSNSAETGDVKAEVDCSIESSREYDKVIGINCKYVLQFLSLVSGDVTICTNSASKPIGLFADDYPGFTHIIMPMHINEGT